MTVGATWASPTERGRSMATMGRAVAWGGVALGATYVTFVP